jgi:hypothetical protein
MQRLSTSLDYSKHQSRVSAAAWMRGHGLPLCIYSAMAIVLTWPLVTHLGVAFPSAPGESAQDLWEKLWNIWWVGEALARGANPFYTDALFYPQGASLLFHPLNLTSALMALPLRALFGPIAAYNLVVLLSFVLSGYVIFLLARAHSCGRAGSLIGGLAYCASTFFFFHTRLSHLELIPMQWLPLYALALDGLLKPTDDRRPLTTDRRISSVVKVLLAGLALLAVIFTSLYVALYAALLTAVWVGWWFAQRLAPSPPTPLSPHPAGRKRVDGDALLRLTAMILLVLAVVGPTLLLPMAREMRQSSYMVAEIDVSARRAAAPADVILPPETHPLRTILPLPIGQTGGAFLGYLPLLLAIYGAIARPRAAARWIALGLLAWALALGPALPFYQWLYALPPLQVARYPDRFLVLTLLAVAVLAALGADALLSRLQIADRRSQMTRHATLPLNQAKRHITHHISKVAAVLLLASIFLELYPGPTPLTTPFDNPFYHTLARDPGRFSVLELPITRNNSAWLAMYAQTIHGHPILDGALARPTPRVPFRKLTLMRQLEKPDTVADIAVEPPGTRQAALRFFGLRYIVYHREDGEGPVVPPTAEALSRVAGVPVRQVYADERLVAYRIDMPEGPATLPVVATIGEGWYDLETPGPEGHRWIAPGGGAVQLYAPQDEMVTLRLKLVAYREPHHLDITLDGQPIGQIVAQPRLAELRTPPFRMTEGPHTLRLTPFGPGIAPRTVGEGADDRPLAVSVFELEIEPPE